MDREESIVFAKKYLEDVLSFFGLNTDVVASADEDVIELKVPSTYLNGFLIGQRGDTLRSLQFLLATTLHQKNAELQRVNVDVADYKRQHNERIAAQAEQWAKQVLDSGQPMTLKPMNAAERRVVHRVIGEYGQLVTQSEGEGRERHVVLSKVAE
ncbi:MAG: single-stranded DNA-binding protein [Candidatus Nomurabacteria bacterium]|jgi:spoIIIJ-associated protein|nr:single-stranded DNA-binding protein [Candidatus Nomurabacteria bacterium]